MGFREAVRDAQPPVDGAYREGKQALEEQHRGRVTCVSPGRLTGSIFLDLALAREPGHANESRWDYGLGYRPPTGPEQAVWIEVHPATTREVGRVLEKLRWLKDWLNGEAEQLLRMTNNATVRDKRFVWMASNGVKIPRGSRQARLLNKNGIGRVRRHLSLP